MREWSKKIREQLNGGGVMEDTFWRCCRLVSQSFGEGEKWCAKKKMLDFEKGKWKGWIRVE